MIDLLLIVIIIHIQNMVRSNGPAGVGVVIERDTSFAQTHEEHHSNRFCSFSSIGAFSAWMGAN
jgi:hypothetical protein